MASVEEGVAAEKATFPSIFSSTPAETMVLGCSGSSQVTGGCVWGGGGARGLGRGK